MRAEPAPLPGDRTHVFSNGTMGETWTANNCAGACIHDSIYGKPNDDEEVHCPLLTLSLLFNVWPREWAVRTVEFETGSYETPGECAEFTIESVAPAEPPVVAIDLFGVFNEEPPARWSA